MKEKPRILVTGVGGQVGIGIVKSLRLAFKNRIVILGCDSSVLASSFYRPHFLDDAFLCKKASERGYVSQLLQIVRHKKIQIIFPGTDHELPPLSQSLKLFEENGIKVVISPQETIRLCRDKWLLFRKFAHVLPFPISLLPRGNLRAIVKSLRFPVFIKPRSGWGSHDIYRVNSIDELKILIRRIKHPLIQEFLEGEEYTIDGFVSRDQKCVVIIPRKRISVLSGITYQGMTVYDKALIALGKKIVQTIPLSGPFNFQVRKQHNRYIILEINPRFAGTGILSTLSGVNIPALVIRDILGMQLSHHIRFKAGVVVSRYIEDIFLTKRDLIRFKK